MPEQKKQHYVPQFYLKLFSRDKERRRISLFNLDSERFVQNANIKHQAYKDNFYGSDKVFEKAFAMLEGRSAEVLSDMIRTDNHPAYYSREHHVMLAFVTMLHARTLYSAEALDEAVDHTLKLIISKDPRFKDDIGKIKIGLSNPAQRSVQLVASMIPIVSDLGYKLLVNETSTSFITSDHPVVFYNQFFETRRTWGSNTGLGSKGLQMFLPLSPRHQLILFDQDIYKVSGSLHHRPVSLKSAEDIENLNCLQLLNANSNLYFDQKITRDYIKSLFLRFSSLRRTAKSDVQEFKAVQNERGHQRSVIKMSKQDIRCGLSLSFVALTRGAKKFKLDNRAVYVRNETLLRVHDEFNNLVAAGQYRPSEFQKFFDEHYGSRFRK